MCNRTVNGWECDCFFRGVEGHKEAEEANRFARAVLMPEQEFKADVRSGMRDILALADKYQVSTLAIRLRAKELGMSGHGL